MELTVHGRERIQGRTKMLTKDVLLMISGGAGVELGSANEAEFLLFYSPPDQCCKIAVMSESRTHLISIWESSYLLPDGLKEVNGILEREARRKLQRFLFQQLKYVKKESPPQYTGELIVQVKIKLNSKVEYTCDLGTILAKDASTPELAMIAALPLLRSIAETIQDKGRKFTKKEMQLLYDVSFLKSETRKPFKHSVIGHKRLMSRLRAV